MIRSLARTLLGLSLTAALAVPGLASAKNNTKAESELAAGQPLTFTVRGDLAPACVEYNCLAWIGTSYKDDDKQYLITMRGDGTWTAFAKDEDYDAEKVAEDGKKALTEKLDAIRKEKGWPTSDTVAEGEELDDEAWRELPVMTEQELAAYDLETNVKGAFHVEKASGKVAPGGADRELVLPAELLPADSFYVFTNGYWGLSLGDDQVGSPSMTGGIKFLR